ncbi:putative sugar transporter [Cryptosporidium canis]|uniref:Hexose transporter 1 n=1 Tax=Cryptosporidium canis TaxID=195482 RepID=A0A9D5DHM7_9CRYT|nr:putative sugar transporter [Cryptosporidium canis]
MSNYSLTRCLIALSVSLLFGVNLSILNFTSPYIHIEFDLCGTEGSLLHRSSCENGSFAMYRMTLAFFTASLLSCFAVKYVVGKSRYFALKVALVPFAIGGVLSSFASNFFVFCTGRFMSGASLGLSAASVTYISEISPKHRRGLYTTLFGLFIPAGQTLSYILGAFLPIIKYLDESDLEFYLLYCRFLFFIPTVLSLVMIIAVHFCCREETPCFLLTKGRFEEAEELLLKIYGDRSVVSDEMESLLTSNKKSAEEDRLSQNVSYSTLFSRKYILPTFITLVITVGVSGSGIGIFAQKMNSLIESASGISQEKVIYIVIFTSAMETISCFFGGHLIEKFGRRNVAIIGSATNSLSLLLLGLFTIFKNYIVGSILPVVSIIVFTTFLASFQLALSPVLWAYVPEALPTEIRSTGMGLSSILNWLVSLIYIPLSYIISDLSIYALSCVCCGLLSIICFFFMKETKGCSVSPYEDVSATEDPEI